MFRRMTESNPSGISLTLRRPYLLVIAAAFVLTSSWAPAAALADDGSEDSDQVVVQQTEATTQTCTNPAIEYPFTAFGDNRPYVLAPLGEFEETTLGGWTLEGGASTASDASGNSALRLPAGSVATSPAMCIDLNYPTVRFMVRNSLGDDADLAVQVMYVDHDSAYKPHTATKLKAKRSWALTKDIKLDPQRGGKEAGWRRVAFRFVAHKDKGDFQIDDLYVDPRMR